MKIEKISDTQIRCTLNRADLQSRELKISELAYGTEKAKDLFHDMIDQASHEFGFEADDLPLMIEAIPVSPDCIVLIITKVEDPEELDTRFSKFAPADEETEDDSEEEDDNDTSDFDLDDIFPTVVEDKPDDDMPDSIVNPPISKDKDTFIPMKETLLKNEITGKQTEEAVNPGEEAVAASPISRYFSFSSFDAVATAAFNIKGNYKGNSFLYKNEDKSLYYLLLTGFTDDKDNFFRVCNEVTEYGRRENMTGSTIAFLKERCKILIKSDAIKILKNI